MLRRPISAILALACLAASAAVASADDVSKKVRNACTSDVKRLCPKDKFGSESLRYCMEANGRKISRPCVQALEDDGVVPRGYFKS